MAEGGPQIRRLIQGEPFYRYDQVTFQNATKYSLDPTTKAKKIISSDIAFVKKWIKRANYLQLLPQYANSFFIVNKDL
jgi:homospermidine synthase